MAALYWQRPAAADVADLGFRPEDYPEPQTELWPENWPPLQLFLRISTQWRVGAGGPIGLDYTVLFHEMDRAGYAGEAYDEMLAAIRVIESAALDHLHKA